VFYSAEPLPPAGAGPQGPPPRAALAARNFGFSKIERMKGNVGYLKFDGFMEPSSGAGDVAAGAMAFLAGTDALIIDLRENGGGSPAMVAFLCTYLFDKPVHLNDLYWRATGQTQQWWTLPFVPGPRYVGKEVYLLTSSRTFSAAEEFTYNLKTQKRATLVGETTGGGANPGGVERLTDHFAAFVPGGRAINPITGTNWEGTGIAPDIQAPADQALDVAYRTALGKLAGASRGPFLDRETKEALDRRPTP
jgi:C-terminal processing protease CtpA/Prc